MPDQNNSTQNPNPVSPSSDAPVAPPVPPIISPQVDLPPLSPDFQNLPENGAPPADKDSGSAAPPDISSVVPKAKKKFGGGKIIATILGLIVLVGGVGAGIVLTQQQQLFQQKAAACLDPCSRDSDCGLNQYCYLPTNGCAVCKNNPTTAPTISPSTPLPPPSSSSAPTPIVGPGCSGLGDTCPVAGIGCCSAYYCNTTTHKCALSATPTPTPTPTVSSTTCSLTGSRICVGNSTTGSCYQGGTGGQYACYKLTGNFGKIVSNCPNGNSTCSCSCPSPYTWQAHENGAWWCFDTAAGECNGQAPYAERCSLQPQQCTSTTPPTTNPPSSSPAAPSCIAVKAYSDAWSALTGTQLSALTAGDIVNFCVSGNASGTFDKAQFMINGNLAPETQTKRPSSNDFCQSYTILSTDTTVSVRAKIHSTTSGWVGESI